MKSRKPIRLLSVALALPFLAVPPLFARGNKNHVMINRLTAESSPADVQAFLRAPDAVAEFAYLSPEPDRWRWPAEPEFRDLIIAAWMKSAEPVPEWHEQSTAPGAPASGNILVMSPPRNVPRKCGKPLPQPDFTGNVYFVGGAVSAPVLTCAPKAEFSEQAQNAKFQGVAVVGLIVDENGIPRNVHVVRPLRMGLDEKAVEAVRKYHFAPATDSNKPVPVAIYMKVPFEMY